MSRNADWVRLRHMLDAARETITFADGRSRTDLDADRAFLMTLYGELIMIGEAASHVGRASRERMTGIPWHETINMRHRMVHEYFALDLDIIWSTVRDDLPVLCAELEGFLRAEGHID
jgi:uncharacterized protein with HEPN domain